MSDKYKIYLTVAFVIVGVIGIVVGISMNNYAVAGIMFCIGAWGALITFQTTTEQKKKNDAMRKRQEEITDRILDKVAPKKEEPKPKDNRNAYYMVLDQKLTQLTEGLDNKKATIRQLTDELFKDSIITKSRYLTATDNAIAIAKDNIRKCRTVAKGFGEYSAPTTEERETLESYVEKAERLSSMLNGIMNEFAKIDLADTSDKNVEDRINDLKETTHLYTVG